MDVREFLRKDQGIDFRIEGGVGTRDDPYSLEAMTARDAAQECLQVIRAIERGLGENWRTLGWAAVQDGLATDVVRVEAIKFTETQVFTTTRNMYFDLSKVASSIQEALPLVAWKHEDAGTTLPYELGWLHYDRSTVNTEDGKDVSVFYGAPGCKCTISVYPRTRQPGHQQTALEALEAVVTAIEIPDLKDPWPVQQAGPMVMKYLLSGEDLTMAGVMELDSYFLKIRLTHVDDPKLRELMGQSVGSLIRWVSSQ